VSTHEHGNDDCVDYIERIVYLLDNELDQADCAVVEMHSGLATMTSAAKCEMGCELQKLVSHHFLERNRHPGDELGYE
jgi:hypothetical protein